MTEPVYFHTPVGRFVSGSLTEKRTTDNNNRPIEPEKQRYDFGLAIRKDDPGVPGMLQSIATAAKAGYPQRQDIQQRVDGWFQTMSGFSMKISDGDKPAVSTGKVNENTAGCFVVWFSTSMDILAANAQNIQIDAASIKRGWYVDVAASARANGLLDHNAGVYMNPSCVRLIAEGEEIVGGMNVETALQNAPTAPTQLPPGARPVGSTPQAPVSSGAPGTGLPGMVPAAPSVGAAPLPGVAPVPTQAAPAPAQTAPAALPGVAPTQPPAQPQTASPGDTGYPPHPGVMQPGLPGTQ